MVSTSTKSRNIETDKGRRVYSSPFFSLALTLVAFFSWIFIQYITHGTNLRSVESPKTLLYAPPLIVSKVTFGYSDIVADSVWLRVIQDLGTCEQGFAEDGPRVGVDRLHNCREGWVYQMLNLVMELAPRWRTPAAIGPLMLSVVVDDIRGANLLFDRAVLNFPTDWTILFRAASHFLYESGDFARAAKYFDEAGKYGAPTWVHSLAAKLYSDRGRNVVARIVLIDALKRVPPGSIRDKMEKRLLEVEKKIKQENN